MKLASVYRFGADLAWNPRALADLPRWLSLYRRRGSADPLALEVPWLTFGAIRLIEGWLRGAHRVFEWGSGGSTLFFSARAAEVVSVEHDAAFYRRVRERLGASARNNASLTLVEPATKGRLASRRSEHRGRFFDDYVDFIERFPPAHFDLISIDGRQRNACARHAAAHLRDGGLIVLDNSDRPYYAPAIASLVALGFRQRRLRGFVPFASHQSETSVFTRGDA